MEMEKTMKFKKKLYLSASRASIFNNVYEIVNLNKAILDFWLFL
jgi:hypothetical protein